MLAMNSVKEQPSKNRANSRAVAVHSLRHSTADRSYYLRSTAASVAHFFSEQVQTLYKTLGTAFTLDSVDWSTFKRFIWPTLSSAAALAMGDYVTQQISVYRHQTPHYDYIYKFLFAVATLGYCALHRITDKQFSSVAGLSAAVASEVTAIAYMYNAVFSGTNDAVGEVLSKEYLLIAGLSTSAVIVPSGISFLTQKAQELFVRRQHDGGAQRSDTALIASGLTPVSNMYFQFNRFITSELQISSRVFQLGLIAHNIRHADALVQKFRNVPALLADLMPAILKKIQVQQERLKYDYAYNNTVHHVLRFIAQEPRWFSLPRYQLRTGDLVHCDTSIDLGNVSVSGELVALKKDDKGMFTAEVVQKKFSVNLKAQTGEDLWIEQQTKLNFDSNYKKIDLYAVRDGKQAGVLVGDKLNIYADDSVFIQIKPEKQFLFSSDYEKKAVINDLISARKQKSVLSSIVGSVMMGALLQHDVRLMSAEMMHLMFTLFQTMIPFSESFLRETVNSGLMRQLNSTLAEQPLDTIDALRVVDLCNALGGYYQEQFSNGVAIISDKTGTLTTTKMNVLGLWTSDMRPEVQEVLKGATEPLLPAKERWVDIFALFCSAFTNNTKELEPEEHAIMHLFNSLLHNEHSLDVVVYGNNHFKKTYVVKEKTQVIETFHLGLYSTFGGRFTLVQEDSNYYLVFCGIPKPQAFAATAVLREYAAMHRRTAVLSRDWCLARANISINDFLIVKDLFYKADKKELEQVLLHNKSLVQDFKFYGTFIIDNPLKKGAEHFISHCREAAVPVFVATGDTVKAAENIATVLCPSNANKINVLKSEASEESLADLLDEQHTPADSTVIFSGIKPKFLYYLHQLLNRPKEQIPVIIFAEMNAEGKGILAQQLKELHYFVVANGDGSNDVMMMKNSHLVIAYHSDDGSFAPGVGELANLSEEQVRRLFSSSKSFYELFDIHLPKSLFIQQFTQLANSQEKPTMALALKSGKMTFDLAKALGADVREMQHQHWYSVAFDLVWLWISFYEINQSADLPMDNRTINASRLVSNTMAISLFIAAAQAAINYTLFAESTNLTSMLLMLSFLPLVLKSVFSGFKQVQESLYPKPAASDLETTQDNVMFQDSIFNYGSFFAHHSTQPSEPASTSLKLE